MTVYAHRIVEYLLRPLSLHANHEGAKEGYDLTTPLPAPSDATSEHLLKKQRDAIHSLNEALVTAQSVGVLTTDNLSDVLHRLTSSKPINITHPPEGDVLKPWTGFAHWWADNYGHILPPHPRRGRTGMVAV